MSTPYKTLDALILERIREKGCEFYELMICRAIRDEADRIARASNRDLFRVLEGRLQALKRQRQIEFARYGNGWNGWQLVEGEQA